MSVDASDRPAGEPSDLDREEFARLFSRNARRIYGFIMTLVFNHHDAEEVFQNTNVILWNKFAEFEPGSNFFAWASRIAYFEVLSLMKQKRRSHTVSDEALELLANEAMGLSHQSSERFDALEECLAKLTAADRELLQERYYRQRPPNTIERIQLVSVHSLYRH